MMMSEISAVLFAVASELAEKAIDNLPKIESGSRIIDEQLDGGIYRRMSFHNGVTTIDEYDFRQKSFRRFTQKE